MGLNLPNVYKRNSIEMAGYMASLPVEKGERRRAERQLNCATFLNYALQGENLKMHLNFANFCHQRTCAVCQAVKSSKLRVKLFNGINRLFSDYSDLDPIFLTLTVKNCHQSELRSTIQQMQAGWHRLTQSKGFPALGYLKSVEVTRPRDCYYAGQFIKRLGTKQINQIWKRPDFNRRLWYESFSEEVHPHLHALLIVHKSYFHPDNFIKQLNWVARWKLAAKLDYRPIVDIRRVYSDDNGIAAVVYEISKYCIKPADLVGKLGFFIVRQMHGLNLISTGGLVRQYCRESDINQILETGETGEELHQAGVPLRIEWSDHDDQYQMTRLAGLEWELN